MSTTDRELTPDEESDAVSVAIETTEDVSPTRGLTGDKLVAERWKRDDPLKTPQVVPSDAPDPTHAQRDFRGWIVIAIVVLIMIGAVLAFTLGLSLLTGLGFGLAPALRQTATSLDAELDRLADHLAQHLDLERIWARLAISGAAAD